MNQYDKLDGEIVDTIILWGDAEFTTLLCFGPTKVTINELAEATWRDRDRILDSRLQSLRKRGLIAYSKGKWRMVEGVK